MGTMKGRDEVRAWITKTMSTFPGSYMTEFPSLWSVIDEDTGRVICELDNPMRDPVTAPSSARPTSRSSPTPATGCGRARRTSQPAALRAGRGEVVQEGPGTRHPRRRGGGLAGPARGPHVSPKLVIGANGFLGSHVTRQLVAAGHQVRVMVRENASTISIDDLDVQRFVGDIWDDDTLRAAMAGCDDVYYCVVDARGWLRDPPLFHTNVEGTRNVLDVALDVQKSGALQRFIYTSSYVTVGRRRAIRPAKPTSSPTAG